VIFIENPGKGAVSTTVKVGGSELPTGGTTIAVKPWTHRMVLSNVDLGYGLRADIAGDVLGRGMVGDRNFVVCHGQPGEKMQVRITGASRAMVPGKWDAGTKVATATIPVPDDDQVVAWPVDGTDGGATLLVMNTVQAARTWFAKDAVVSGAWYLHEDQSIEFASGQKRAQVWSATGMVVVNAPAEEMPPHLPALASWTWRDAAPEAVVAYNDLGWSSNPAPLALSANGDFQNAFGWYRASFIGDGKPLHLYFGGLADRAEVFLNGEFLGDAKGSSIDLTPKSGANVLALFTAHNGRNKLFNFTGTVGSSAKKGVWGPVFQIAGKPLSLTRWRMDMNNTGPDKAGTFAAPGFDDSQWKEVSPSGDLMRDKIGQAWFRCSFELTAEQTTSSLVILNGVDDEGWLFVNGKQIGHHADWATAATFAVDQVLVKGHNVIAVCVKNTGGAGGLTKPVDIATSKSFVATWRFHGGLAGLEETAIIGRVTNWPAFIGADWTQPKPDAKPWPRFWCSTVGRVIPTDGFTTVGIKTTGLIRGAVWINGHNLGLYRGEELLYVPECWLTDRNTVVVYDETGASPMSVVFQQIEHRQYVVKALHSSSR